MAGYSPTDAIEPVDGINSMQSGQQAINAIQGDATSEESRWQKALESKQAVHTYSCYMLMVQMINHLSLDKLDTEVIAESQMMDIEHKMQSNLIDISQFISKLQGEATSYAPYSYSSGGPTGGPEWSQDSFLGLKEDFYVIGEAPYDWGVEKVSTDYQTSLDKFLTAFKNLFYCNTDTTAPTVGSMSFIANPNVFQQGQGFDLTSLWSNLEQQYSTYARSYSSDPSGKPYGQTHNFKVVSSNPSDHASLIQQYMFYKAQLIVDRGSVDAVNNAHGDISKLIDLGTDSSGDAFLAQAMQIISMFNTSDSVSRTIQLQPWVNTQSANILDLILQNQYNIYIGTLPPQSSNNGEETANSPGVQGGLYVAFSYMAFNYFWTKATSSTEEETISEPPEHASPVTAPGNAGSDLLTGAYSGINSVVTGLGTITGDESTVMQELTSNEAETLNIGQGTIKNLNTAIQTFDTNQIDS